MQKIVRDITRNTWGRLALAGLAVILAIVVASAVYIFGGGGGSSPTNKPVTVPTLVPSKTGTIFTIDATASTASFTIDEVLFGQPNTVVGKTNSIAGQILVDKQDPSKSQLGEIKVDLSTLATDNDFRNRALQGRILETGQPANQYAVFVAKSLSGLPASVAVGQRTTFHITGDLTIHQVTRTVTFDIQLTPKSATELVGHAQTTVKYEDFGLSIPNVPSVTDVGEDVVLALDFTARA